jgi:hypothetical protein
MPQTSLVTRFGLAQNCLRSTGVSRIATAIKNNSSSVLTFLDLGRNPMGSKGCSHLAEALEVNRTLRELVLDCCGIDAEGCKALGEMLESNFVLQVRGPARAKRAQKVHMLSARRRRPWHAGEVSQAVDTVAPHSRSRARIYERAVGAQQKNATSARSWRWRARKVSAVDTVAPLSRSQAQEVNMLLARRRRP